MFKPFSGYHANISKKGRKNNEIKYLPIIYMETKRGNPHNGFVQNYTIADDIAEKRFRIAYKIGQKCKSIKKRYNENNKMDIMQQMLMIQRNLIHPE